MSLLLLFSGAGAPPVPVVPVVPLPPPIVPVSIGDATDFLNRLKTLLPAGWYPSAGEVSGTPDTPTPALDAALSAPATVDARVYALAAYARLQALIGTATDGLLDIKAADYLGPAFLRQLGELDPAFQARVLASLLPQANTRAVIQSVIERVTGYPARMIEPWQPRDNAIRGRFFHGVNSAVHPGNRSDGGRRYQGLVAASLPAFAAPAPRFARGSFYRGANGTGKQGLSGWHLDQVRATSGAGLVYQAIEGVRSVGVSVYVKFLTPAKVQLELSH